MTRHVVTEEENAQLDALIRHYEAHSGLFPIFAQQLLLVVQSPPLKDLYHSFRSRLKDPTHLRDKLKRTLIKDKEAGRPFGITTENLFEKINDLVGVRLLHLHTSEFPQINATLIALLEENRYTVLEGPVARVWDDEYREYFNLMDVQTVKSQRMYTSVHYVIEGNRKTKLTAEIQVRTLAEELWGEVDHKINYPQPSEKLACREQIKVLARVTSSCTRLVDSIFRTHEENPSDAATR